jgi:hypothetical protein
MYAGDKLTHKHSPNITIELIEPTAKGWKVIERNPQAIGKKEKFSNFSSNDIADLFIRKN